MVLGLQGGAALKLSIWEWFGYLDGVKLKPWEYTDDHPDSEYQGAGAEENVKRYFRQSSRKKTRRR